MSSTVVKVELEELLSLRIKRQYSESFNNSELFNCINSSPEAYKCGSCDFETFLMLNLDKHIKVAHKVLDQSSTDNKIIEKRNIELLGLYLKSFLCTHCCFETYSELLWYKHVTEGCAKRKEFLEDRARKKQEKFYECHQCKYIGKEKSYLKSHLLTVHSTPENAKWYYCEQCPHRTKYRNCLRAHIQAKHGNIYPYKCNYCRLKTKRKGNLKRHVRNIHKTMNWYDCEQCDFTAKRKYMLSKHIKETHSSSTNNDKMYHCPHCIYKFKREIYLTKHLKLIHENDNNN